MTEEISFVQEIIKMIPVVTDALIAGIVAVLSIIITHRLNEKKEKKAIRFQKIEELSKQLTGYHAFTTKQSLYMTTTGKFMEEEYKTFYHTVLINIYLLQLSLKYDKYIKEVHTQINALMNKQTIQINLEKNQKLYSDLINSVNDEANKLIT